MAERDSGAGRRLVLVGMMGSGKTTVGRALAMLRGWPFVDSDDIVHELAGIDPAAVAAIRGVDELHRLELAALEEMVRRPAPLVAAAAAFAVVDAGTARLLRRRATVCWLRARPATLRARIGDGAGRRVDARSQAWLTATAAAREPAFAAAADFVLDVDDRSVEDLAAELAGRLVG